MTSRTVWPWFAVTAIYHILAVVSMVPEPNFYDRSPFLIRAGILNLVTQVIIACLSLLATYHIFSKALEYKNELENVKWPKLKLKDLPGSLEK